jgi:hypothetical protein
MGLISIAIFDNPMLALYKEGSAATDQVLFSEIELQSTTHDGKLDILSSDIYPSYTQFIH